MPPNNTAPTLHSVVDILTINGELIFRFKDTFCCQVMRIIREFLCMSGDFPNSPLKNKTKNQAMASLSFRPSTPSCVQSLCFFLPAGPCQVESHGATHLYQAIIDRKRGVLFSILLSHLQSNLGWQPQMASLIQVNYLLNLSEQTDVSFCRSLG